MSILSKFDPRAMVNPKTPEDIIALLNEAIFELENINSILDKAFPDSYNGN